jgi:hypothetical protein
MMLGSTTVESLRNITTPKNLGLSGYSEIKQIFIGDCGSQDDHYDLTWRVSPYGGAHAHACPYDPLYKCICVSDADELLDDIETPSTLFLHEYAHVLTEFPEIYLKHKWRCVGPKSLHAWDSPVGENIPNWDAHNKEWEDVMRSLGQEPYLWVPPSRMSKFAQAGVSIK